MKRTLKKFVALVAVFVMLITAIPVSAASDAATHTWVADSIKGYVSIKSQKISLDVATTQAKKISYKVANPKIGKLVYEDIGFMKSLSFVPKSAGKTVITTKVGNKTFKTNVTVYKYTNPISSIKIGNIAVSGSKLAKTDRLYLSYDKYVGKKLNLIFNVKKGWNYIWSMDLKDKKGNYISNNIVADDNGLFKNLEVKGGKGNYIYNFWFTNSKNHVTETISIVFK